MMEIWKDVEGYDNYQISTFGRVLNTKTQKLLVQQKQFRGYMLVSPSKNGIQKKFVVHRLVANAFIPNPTKKPFINHIDTIKQNNMINNLEWSTPSENMKHAVYNNLINRNHSKYNRVNQYTKSNEFIHSFKNCTEASKITGIEKSTIFHTCQGKLKSAGSFIWKFDRDIASIIKKKLF